MPRQRTSLVPTAVLAAVVLTTGLLTGCTSNESGRSGPTSSTTEAAPATNASPSPKRAPQPGTDADPARACITLPSFDHAILTYPGADPDAPPTPAQLSAWAKPAASALATIAANVPPGLDKQLALVKAAIVQAQQGHRFAPEHAVLSSAIAAIDKAGYDNCGFPRMAAVATRSALSGVPSKLGAGPVSVSFTNRMPTTHGGFVLLVARLHSGQTATAAQVRANHVDLARVADIVVAATPAPGSMVAYTTVQLAPGRYIIATPLGAPSQVTGALASDLIVH